MQSLPGLIIIFNKVRNYPTDTIICVGEAKTLLRQNAV